MECIKFPVDPPENSKEVNVISGGIAFGRN
jgi:hypothetical protein